MRKKEPVRADTPLRRSARGRLQQGKAEEQPPFVRLKRLDGPPQQEAAPDPQLQKPTLEWGVVTDRRARLQVPEGARLWRSAQPEETASHPPPGASQEPQQQPPARAVGLTPRPKAPLARKEEAAPTRPPGPGRQRLLPPLMPTLCGCLSVLALAAACWFFWEYGSPEVASLGLTGFGPWRWPSLWGEPGGECSAQCRVVLVESIPACLEYGPGSVRHPSIFGAWMELLAGAASSVEIAAFYFTLRGADIHVRDPSSQQGREVFEALLGLPARGVELAIAVNSPQMSEDDTSELAAQGADVRLVDMKRLTGGIVHTKLWVVDQKHVYLGSANMDWRSLTQVKELGAVLYNCSCLARDLRRVFAIYRLLGEPGASIPAQWPASLAAESSREQPLKLQLNGTSAELYLSSSPPALSSQGRTADLAAIVSTIADAQEFVSVSVMDYQPECVFCRPRRFWPAIDDALRSAACERRVAVRLLISCWRHSRRAAFVYLESLAVLRRQPLSCPIEVKLFAFPEDGPEALIPYTHVNHNKYMVTDRVAYIGTSNWSEDYFTRTTGVGLVINQTEAAGGGAQGSSLRRQLEGVFRRDWDSPYALPLHDHWKCATENGGRPAAGPGAQQSGSEP
ncbi:5'-3' exonuclease PLD3-like isoform X2 [Hemicordylus capensis]|uniref:5'-3' exonuclease PLD3-like isoform X2 n=1 Tax=Hemicordylus capensis TaxID=884348 RepID=UPI002302235B|nr:5'-3' exonuclease PLD3-like isoform X2 [Hemicordylus capensis]